MGKAEKSYMKVVHINTAHAWSGGEVQTYYLIQDLIKKGVENVIIAQPNSPLAKKAKADNLNCIELSMKGELDFLAGLKLRKLLKQIKPDIIQAHTAHAQTLALFARKKIKLVSTRRMDYSISRLSAIFKYNRADKIVAISNFTKDVLIQAGVKKNKLAVIHDAVDSYTITQQAETAEPLNFKKDDILIGTVAALVERKGHKYIFKAMTKVKKQFPKARLLVIGQGSLEKDLKELAKSLDLKKEIIFLGFQKNIPAILKKLDVFVLYPLREGLGVASLEAGACSLPTVASKVGGLQEVVEDGQTGFLVPPKNPHALADKINFLLANPEMRITMGKKAKQRVETIFSVEKMVDSYIKIYKELLTR